MEGADADPVVVYTAAYTKALGASLRGPRRAKERMLTEIGEGLRDAAEPHRLAGSDPATAVERAIGEFGRPHDLVPDCQRELTIRQTRHTAGRLALCVPVLLVGWHLLWVGTASDAWRVAAIVLAAVTALGALEAVAALVLTSRLGRTLPAPPRLPAVTAWTASVTSIAMLLATVSLALGVGGVAALGPLLLAVAAAVVGHGVVAGSARACRACDALDRSGG
jgi:hypothetical protein